MIKIKTIINKLLILQYMFESVIRDIDHFNYVRHGIEMGWFPANLVDVVLSSMETLLKNCKFQKLPSALVSSNQAFTAEVNSLMPPDYAAPIKETDEADLEARVDSMASQIRTVRHPFRMEYRKVKARKDLFLQSGNPYERLSLLMGLSESERKFGRKFFEILHGAFWYTNGTKIQDALVNEVLFVAELEALRGRHDTAIALLEDVIDKRYVWWESRKNVLVSAIGQIYLLKGDLVRAECSFKEVQRRNVWYLEGEYGALLYNHRVSLVLLQNGEIERAGKAFERVKEFLPHEKSIQYDQNYKQLLEIAGK